MNESPFLIELLGSHHDRTAFSCGEPALNAYLHRQASQDALRRIAQVYVAVAEQPGEILGYYTLSAASFEKGDLSAALVKRLPHYPVPVALIGRLAVAHGYQGRGLGENLLLDAIHRVVRVSNTLGVYAVVVEAKSDRASAFYEHYGFKPFLSWSRRLFLPLQTFVNLGL